MIPSSCSHCVEPRPLRLVRLHTTLRRMWLCTPCARANARGRFRPFDATTGIGGAVRRAPTLEQLDRRTPRDAPVAVQIGSLRRCAL